MSDAPILFVWRDHALHPANTHWLRKAEDAFGDGEMVEMVRHEERSANSHRHYFATLREVHHNLPDEMLDEYPNPEVLRKKLLIRAGYCTHSDFPCESESEALKLKTWLQPKHEYAIFITSGRVVRMLEPESQSQRAMGKKRFQESKTAVFDQLAKILGVTTSQLEEAGRQ